jgi:hypothetical protein
MHIHRYMHIHICTYEYVYTYIHIYIYAHKNTIMNILVYEYGAPTKPMGIIGSISHKVYIYAYT